MVKVFLSSTFDDLVEYRRNAAEALERLDLQGVRMEVFGGRPAGDITVSLGEINSSEGRPGLVCQGVPPK